MSFNKKLSINDWAAIKLYYNDDGTKKIYPPRKGVMQGSYHKKNWNNNGSFDKFLFSVYSRHKKLINELSKKKYGIEVSLKTLTIKKTIGGLFINGKKAMTIKRDIQLINLKNILLKKQILMIENLFNKD